ncbi:MAG: hypothetical protein WBL35_02625 [Ornithinibacter sp.]
MRPERPALAGQAPAPLSGAVAIPDVVARTLMTWNVSLALTGFAIVTMLIGRVGIATQLKESLLERDPSISVTTLDTATPRIVLAVIGALTLVVLLELVLVRTFAGRRSWPRLALVPIVILHVVVALLASLLVPETAWQGWVLSLALYAGTLAALAAIVRSFFPSVSAWARGARPEPNLS